MRAGSQGSVGMIGARIDHAGRIIARAVNGLALNGIVVSLGVIPVSAPAANLRLNDDRRGAIRAARVVANRRYDRRDDVAGFRIRPRAGVTGLRRALQGAFARIVGISAALGLFYGLAIIALVRFLRRRFRPFFAIKLSRAFLEFALSLGHILLSGILGRVVRGHDAAARPRQQGAKNKIKYNVFHGYIITNPPRAV